MNDRVLRVLEFDKVLNQLTELTMSDLGKKMALQLKPCIQMSEILYAQQETAEAEAIVYRLGHNPVRSFDDIGVTLSRAKSGAVLSMRELLQVAQSLSVCRSVQESIKKQDTQETNEPIIHGMALGLVPLRSLEEEILSCIMSEEEMADHASPALAGIRRKIRVLHDKMKEKLNAMIRSAQFQKYLQDPIITQRQDRYVLPVKQEYKAQVPGIVHDQSASGVTLFIEPMVIVEINNEIRMLLADERDEIERILRELTLQVEEKSEILFKNLALLTKLDFAFAKGQLSKQLRGVKPSLNQKGKVNIIRGRHPLIDPLQVVPLNIWLGDGHTTLIVTGPNTGGKTVLLKTVGLLTLMAQAGLHIPADLGTEMAVFEEVYADIGDEQSIEQSLSTFSSHMTNIVRFVKKANANSLVLFDELGAGTDPVEGAALAMAILEVLHERETRTLATTHYSELKGFALSKEGYENASMEFDVESLRPTYRVFMGIPGRSNAFEISKRLGLQQSVIDRAKEHLKGEDVQFEHVISEAEERRTQAEKDMQAAAKALREGEQLKQKMAQMQELFEQTKKEAIKKAKEEAKRILELAQVESNELLRHARKLHRQGLDAEAETTIREQKQKLKNTLADLQDEEEKRQINPDPPVDLKEGELVEVLSLRQQAQVCTKPTSKGDVTVKMGNMKITVKTNDLIRISKKENEKKSIVKTPDRLFSPVRMEIDLRGYTVEEGIIEVDRFLDDAVMTGLSSVSIIHGKGTGALRAGLQTFLQTHPHVKTFRLGVYGEGETGVSIVELK